MKEGFERCFKGCFAGDEFKFGEFIPSFREEEKGEFFYLVGPGTGSVEVISISEEVIIADAVVGDPSVVQ